MTRTNDLYLKEDNELPTTPSPDTFYILVTDNDSVYLYTKGKTRPKKHKELYEKLDKLLAEKHVLVTKTKAHNGKAHKTTNFNGIVDSLARHTYRLLANK